MEQSVNVRRESAPVIPKERRNGRSPGWRERKTPEKAPEVSELRSPAKLLADANAKAIAILCAGMAELVDARVSKTRSLGSAGSIPAARTNRSSTAATWLLAPNQLSYVRARSESAMRR